jgi:hypothetical protein
MSSPSSVIPESEVLRRAVKWISAQLQENPAADRNTLLQEVVFRFDLSPKDAEFLYNMYKQK